jgi:snurportin-1
MLPEWMVDVPPDLGSSWYVTPRPSGQRCLVIASRGATVSRLKTGRVLHRFPSALPGGAVQAECSWTHISKTPGSSPRA